MLKTQRKYAHIAIEKGIQGERARHIENMFSA